MVNKVTLKDRDRFYKLGEFVHSDFKTLFLLEDILASPYDYILGYYDASNILLGFVHFSKLYETIDIINIVVDTCNRHCGIASQLLKEMFTSFEDVTSIMLEVNENNVSAIHLYEKCGFYVINKRKNYYGSVTALIMKRDV